MHLTVRIHKKCMSLILIMSALLARSVFLNLHVQMMHIQLCAIVYLQIKA